MNDTSKFESYSRFLTWFMAFLLVAFAAGCGSGGDEGRDPILGTPGIGAIVPPTVPDTTRPSVTVTVPANAAPTVAINTAITAVFSEEMAPATITAAGTFTVTCATPCVSPAGAVTYVVGSRTAVFTPAAVLTPGTLYTATITVAATDVAGNALIVPAVGGLPVPNPWTFTTAPAPALDITAPLVNSTVPANGAANVAVAQNISATFNETMNTASVVNAFTLTGPGATPVPGVVTYNAATSIATFNPTNALTPGVTYTATISTAATDLAGNALVVPAVGGLPAPNPWTFSIPLIPPVIPPVVILGAAAPFGAFGGAAGITNQGVLTVIDGNIGTTGASTLITGFHDTAGCIYTETPLNIGAVNGTIFTAAPPPVVPPSAAICTTTEGNAVTAATAQAAALAALAAFNDLSPASRPGATDPGANLGGLTLAPGIYATASGGFLITGTDLTLDAGGNADAIWVFQMANTLTVGAAGAPRSVILAGGAQPKNVFWQVGSAATINAAGGGTMVGTIISSATTTFSTAGNAAITTLNGRALSLNASVTMVNTVINVPAP